MFRRLERWLVLSLIIGFRTPANKIAPPTFRVDLQLNLSGNTLPGRRRGAYTR